VPSGEVHSNVLSLAMTAAAVHSARTGQRVVIAMLLEEAHRQAAVAQACSARVPPWPGRAVVTVSANVRGWCSGQRGPHAVQTARACWAAAQSAGRT